MRSKAREVGIKLGRKTANLRPLFNRVENEKFLREELKEVG